MAKSVVVGTHEAKTHLSRLLDRVVRGEEIEIARRGVVIARLVPPVRTGRRQFGESRGKFVVPDDFDAPLSDEELDLFYR